MFEAPKAGPVTSAPSRAAVESSLDALRKLPGVTSVTDPYQTGKVAPNGSLALATVNYQAQPSQITTAQQDALTAAPAPARDAGMTVVIGGTAIAANGAFPSTEVIGVLAGAVVLAVTFGSLAAAGLPLLTAIIGVGTGLAALYTVSHWVQLSSTSPILALMLGLAVGIDYALFIISRFRHELLRGTEPEEAAGIAGGTAGSAVVFAGLTVFIALAGPAVVGIPFLTVMGLAAAGTVAAAVLIAHTLLPALLGFAGRKVIGTRIPGVRRPDYDDSAPDAKTSFGERWARLVTRRRGPVLIAGIALLAVLAIPVLSMRTGLPDNSTAAPGSGPRAAYDLIAKDFGPGYNGPLTIVITGDAAHTQPGATAVAGRLRTMPDIASASAPLVNPARDAAVISAVPRSAPAASDTTTLVNSIRSLAPGLEQSDGVQVYVTGTTALNVDVSDKLTSAPPLYLVVVIGLAIVPAVMSMLGRSAWWLSRWLARVLPNVDIEGQSLLDRRPDVVDAGEADGVPVS